MCQWNTSVTDWGVSGAGRFEFEKNLSQIFDFVNLCSVLGNWPTNIETIKKQSTPIYFLTQENGKKFKNMVADVIGITFFFTKFRALTLQMGTRM